MLKRAAENRERKTTECAPETATSGGSCSRGQGPKPRQHWGNRQKKSQPDKGWDFTLWWRNTEPNPRPRSSPESVRKDTVPILNHLAVFVGIRQIGRPPISPGSMLPTASQSLSEIASRTAAGSGNALALTRQGDCITMNEIHSFDRSVPWLPPLKSNPP